VIRIGFTMGDPAGVGPEVLLHALNDPLLRRQIRPIVFGDHDLLSRVAEQFGCDLDFELRQVGQSDPSPGLVGKFTENGGRAQGAYLQAAADAIQASEIDALVTGPIHKRALKVCNMPGPGQTEWLASRFGVERPVMMLLGPSLKVVLATTHLALAKVPQALNKADLVKTITVAQRDLTRLFFPTGPRWAVAALNPHGEVDGEIGAEELNILIPLVEELASKGFCIRGPIAGDTVFALAASGKFDVVLALYHDQGLAALKTLHFSEAVNVTLGLGLIRTAPDHGVAYDIAGRGQADPTSMKQATRLAVEMARKNMFK